MKIIQNIGEMQKLSNDLKRNGKRIGFVPTMGGLHDGHLSLIDIAKKNSDVSIISIFLNPAQFNNKADLATYPASLTRDLELAEARSADIAFYPETKAIYPENFETFVEVKDLTKRLCGASRPGHFKGVTTVVLKLFNIVKPAVAVFGMKDFQQLRVIKKMVTDLNLDVRIIPAPIIRESDGLAMSSRNVRLGHNERRDAISISRGINNAVELSLTGVKEAKKLIDAVAKEIKATETGRIDYITLASPETFEIVKVIEGPTLLAVAAFFGKNRLIDNTLLNI